MSTIKEIKDAYHAARTKAALDRADAMHAAEVAYQRAMNAAYREYDKAMTKFHTEAQA